MALLVVAAVVFGAPGYIRKAYYVQNALAQSDPSRAYPYARKAAEVAPAQADLWEMAGRYAWQAGLPAEAVQAYERAAELGALSATGWLELGQAYHALQQDSAALRAWDVGAVLYKPAPALLRAAADLRLQNGNLGAIEHSLQDLANAQPSDAVAWRQLGLIQLALDPPRALGALDRAANLDPSVAPLAQDARRAVIAARSADDPAYRLLMAGRVLAGHGEWGLALQAFARATVLQPKFAEAWAYRGEALQHPGQGSLLPLADAGPAAGQHELETALALDPHSLPALSFMALFWTRQGRPDLAVDLAERAVQQEPESFSLLVQLADAQARAGQLEQADQTYRRLAALAPGELLYRRLWIVFLLDYSFRSREEVLSAARQLVIDFPEQAAALDTLGQALMQVNDLENARRTLQRAVQAGTDYAPAYLHLGQVELLLGHPVQGRAYIQQALSLDPQGESAALARRLLEAISQ